MTGQETKILDLVQQLSQAPATTPAMDQPLFESGVLDSFGLPDLVAALEGEFGVKVPDSDLVPANFASIRAISRYLDARSAAV